MSEQKPPSAPDTPDAFAERLRAAYAAHDRYYSRQASLLTSVIEFSHSALRSAAVLNGGAAIAILAFIGALVTSDRVQSTDFRALVDSLTWFGVGVFSSTLATGSAYLAQFFYHWAESKHELTWDHPFVVEMPSRKGYDRVGQTFHATAASLTIASYLLFAWGAAQFTSFASQTLSERASAAATSVSGPEGAPNTLRKE